MTWSVSERWPIITSVYRIISAVLLLIIWLQAFDFWKQSIWTAALGLLVVLFVVVLVALKLDDSGKWWPIFVVGDQEGMKNTTVVVKGAIFPVLIVALGGIGFGSWSLAFAGFWLTLLCLRILLEIPRDILGYVFNDEDSGMTNNY